jgi:hypothetical protein
MLGDCYWRRANVCLKGYRIHELDDDMWLITIKAELGTDMLKAVKQPDLGEEKTYTDIGQIITDLSVKEPKRWSLMVRAKRIHEIKAGWGRSEKIFWRREATNG